jgi:hypothetical protein
MMIPTVTSATPPARDDDAVIAPRLASAAAAPPALGTGATMPDAPPPPTVDRAKALLSGTAAPVTRDEQVWVQRTRQQMVQLSPVINSIVDAVSKEMAQGRDASALLAESTAKAVPIAAAAGLSIAPQRRQQLLAGAAPATPEEQVYLGGMSLIIQQMIATMAKLIAIRGAELRANAAAGNTNAAAMGASNGGGGAPVVAAPAPAAPGPRVSENGFVVPNIPGVTQPA